MEKGKITKIGVKNIQIDNKWYNMEQVYDYISHIKVGDVVEFRAEGDVLKYIRKIGNGNGNNNTRRSNGLTTNQKIEILKLSVDLVKTAIQYNFSSAGSELNEDKLAEAVKRTFNELINCI